MVRIPIIFAFDNNLIEAACVCFTSLLHNAKPETFYDIYVLHSPHIKLDESTLKKIQQQYSNCSIDFVPVDDSFEEAFEIRHVTKATYYRLLIPELFPDLEKAIYSDVDIIYRMDLQDIFLTDMSDTYVAGTLDIGMNTFELDYVNTLEIKQWDYIQAGFLLMNLSKMRQDNMVKKFKTEAAKCHKYQDQDTLNISCKGHITILPPCCNLNDCSYIQFLSVSPSLPSWITEAHISQALKYGNIHYSGYKPWQRYCLAFDIWWQYYRLSPIYNEYRYYKFFYDKTLLFDSLSLWKRVKGVLRYFIHGRYKG